MAINKCTHTYYIYTYVHIYFTLRVPDVELIYLLREFVLLNGLSARNGKGEAPFEVLHLVHGADARPLQHTPTHKERQERRLAWIQKDTQKKKKKVCLQYVSQKQSRKFR